MKYLSVCSGIEAATVAWHPLGWEPIGFAEIEPFPAAVLAHHYPNVPNFGDMTKYKEWDLESGTVDLLVGGTPCQSFSVAGLRKGLADPRGNLALVYCGILDHLRPQWFVWENVPGVLSSGGGRDFGSFLGALAELGYGFAYRVLDAQYFGVAQRRRRVFVVGHLGDWRPAAEVLFEPESLRGNPAPSREARQGVAGTLKGGSGSRGYPDPSDGNGGMLTLHQPYPVANCLTARMHKGMNSDLNEGQTPVVAIQGNLIGRDAGGPNGVGASADGTMYTLTKADVHGVAQPIGFNARQDPDTWRERTGPLDTDGSTQAVCVTGDITHTLKAEGFDASEDGTGRGQPIVAQPVAEYYSHDYCQDRIYSPQAISPALNCSQDHKFRTGMAVRRLTPVECERLQGFPDNYTNIPWRKQPESPDGPRYKALGNSMAVPVMAWIGRRIAMYNLQQSRMVA